ncbi:MAG TPA: HAD-IC family P-type ATPase, partial [Longimicrobium sp.]|nr:HAD-IC family P-type ATPase [Longimicrobium sp.]
IVAGGRSYALTGAGFAPEGEVRDGDQAAEPREDGPLHRLLVVAALANRAELVRGADGWTVRGDPTEGALLAAARKAGLDPDALGEAWPEVGEVPFSSERMLMATFHRAPDGAVAAFAKGAPGRLIDLCDRALTDDGELPLDEAGRERLKRTNEEMAARGLRVLAFAWREKVGEVGAEALRGMAFLGFSGMMDPPAEGVPETIRLLRDAGIRTVMITGDQRLTALAVGRELGIVSRDEEVMNGADLSSLSPEVLAERVCSIGAFSRVSPEDKLRLVDALQREGQIVAMLGDGVNDAAALRKADVGVAMGGRGTDVAKEAAAVVLLDDRFATVGAAVEEGRVIFTNLRKFVFYLFSCNLAEILVLLLAGLAALPSPLLPLQILWMNLVTDTFPALALAVEPADPDVMRHPPRDPKSAILSREFLGKVALYGGLITAAAFGAYLLARGEGTEVARTVAFTTLSLAQVFHLGNARSVDPVLTRASAFRNRWAVLSVAAVVALQLAALYVPPLARVLRVVPLGVEEWLLVAPLAVAPAVIGQA